MKKPTAKKFGRRYPWDKWLTSNPVILKRGRDFLPSVVIFAQMIRNMASYRRVSTRVQILDEARIRVVTLTNLPPGKRYRA